MGRAFYSCLHRRWEEVSPSSRARNELGERALAGLQFAVITTSGMVAVAYRVVGHRVEHTAAKCVAGCGSGIQRVVKAVEQMAASPKSE